MQLKQSYNIATKASSRKSAIIFGDLPGWSCCHEAFFREPNKPGGR